MQKRYFEGVYAFLQRGWATDARFLAPQTLCMTHHD